MRTIKQRKGSNSKGQVNWMMVAKVCMVLYYIVGFVAAVLTVLRLLGLI